MRVRLIHIITSLRMGGAEMMLTKLVSQQNRERFDIRVFSLMPDDVMGAKIRALGIPVHSLNMDGAASFASGLFRLTALLRREKPDVVQTWMYHADLLGGIAARFAGCRALAWNIRNSTLAPQTSKRSTRLIAALCARLSKRLPDRIVCCSERAQQIHVALGYTAEKFMLLPNGFDLNAFSPNPMARKSVRQELSVPENALLVGMVARFDPQKDHQTFLKAAARLHQALPETHFLLCGAEIEETNAALANDIAALGLSGHVHLLGRRDDVNRLNAALDIATLSSSSGEAFPNVLGEAMACGVPCVATDVGDSASIVGETGRIVPPNNPEALAAAWQDLLQRDSHERLSLGKAARCRVQAHFDLPVVTSRYESLYEELIGHAAARG